MSHNLRETITHEIKIVVRDSSRENKNGPPLVGFANANHPLFAELKRIVDQSHYLPSDILPGARSVVSFFIPFSERVVRSNQKGNFPTNLWAHTKKDTEELIDFVITEMGKRLAAQGIRSSGNVGLEPYDETKYFHRWSQKHVAYLCGLGNFGLNHLLITESGCAGRLGSFVIDTETEYDPIVIDEFCPYKVDGSCGICVQKCPSNALNFEGLEKATCRNWIIGVTEKYFQGDRDFRSCGKCITLPCALQRPKIVDERKTNTSLRQKTFA